MGESQREDARVDCLGTSEGFGKVVRVGVGAGIQRRLAAPKTGL